MLVAEGSYTSKEVSLKLGPTISLDEMDMATKAPLHALMEKVQAISGSKFGSYENIGFPGEYVYRGEGKETTKVDGVHLDYFPRPGCLWYRSPDMVLLPTGTNDVPLRQYLIDLGYREVDTMLTLKEILDLLPAALVLTLSDGPYPTLQYRVNLSSPSLPLLGLLVAIQEGHQTAFLDASYPELDGLPVLSQSRGDS